MGLRSTELWGGREFLCVRRNDNKFYLAIHKLLGRSPGGQVSTTWFVGRSFGASEGSRKIQRALLVLNLVLSLVLNLGPN